MLRSVQDLLHPHLHNDVGMGADPRAARGDIAQHRVERRARLAAAQRIDPNENAISTEQLRPYFFGEILVIDRWLSRYAECRQLLEDAVIAIVLRRRSLPRLAVTAPQNGDSIECHIRLREL